MNVRFYTEVKRGDRVMKVAFFDRDGTIIRDYPDSDWRYVEQPEFFSDSIQTLKEVIHKGYEIIIVTNQYLINEQIISLDKYQQLTNKVVKHLNRNEIKILDIFYCPHGRSEGCSCIKPNTGMIDKAIQKYPHINIDESFIIGDSKVDIELGLKMKMKTFGIRVGSSYNSSKVIQLQRLGQLLNYI